VPPDVLAEVNKINELCSDQPLRQADIDACAVQGLDLNGDGLSDYLINDASLPSGVMASCRHGSHGGAGIVILVQRGDGSFIKAFDQTVQSLKVDLSKERPSLWAQVGGRYCGQDGSFASAEAIQCERELIWVPEKEQVDFARHMQK